MCENHDVMHDICLAQEEELMFDSFSRDDALKLGLTIIEHAKKYKQGVAVTIKLFNAIVFSYLGEGTTTDNLMWMDRKRNTVELSGMSSLRYRYHLQKIGETLTDRCLDSFNYTVYGGGFPLQIKGTGMVGVICVSALPHLDDHQLMVSSLKDYLNRPEVPDLPNH